jgi:hypothetical protein
MSLSDLITVPCGTLGVLLPWRIAPAVKKYWSNLMWHDEKWG